MTQQPRDTPQFYLTAPTTCPYLPGKEERKVFTHLVGDRAAALNDMLTHGGFRRSQSIAYRPACELCRACVSVRVVVDDFVPTASQKRAMRRNADVVGDVRGRCRRRSSIRCFAATSTPATPMAAWPT
ncbi:arginine-tRNA-protein transferase [Blastochloris viridis]|uniref:Arginine-tRNA-protein transferase n=1 Tax=Blastochloris viridis TaxID=1079 RepID=A0A182D3X4_BLAVI|nr:arginine-tRNA-protein transferase [Blastochloris viridis]